MTWNPLTQPTDKVILGGLETPGLAEVLGASSARKWDILSGQGMSGGILIYRGIEPSQFTIRIRLLTEVDWDDWARFRPIVLRPPIGKIARTFDITHPVLNEVNIHACVIKDVTAPTQGEDGEWVIEITCIESRVPRRSRSKPDAAEATPFDPREQKIKDLTAERDAQRDALANDPGNE
jgi:hypothetical protein